MATPRANHRVRDLLRRDVLDFLRRNWRLIGGASLAWLVTMLGFTWWMVVSFGWDFQVGLFIGLVLAGSVYMWEYMLSWAGFRPRQMGLQAEQETGRILDRLDGSWQVEPNVFIEDTYDIDHVITGPGRIYAVETKWSSVDPSIHGWMSRVARARAEGLARALKACGVERDVVPVLVLWGRAVSGLPKNARSKHGVRVVAGPEWKDWLPKLEASSRGSEPDVDVLKALDAINRDAPESLP